MPTRIITPPKKKTGPVAYVDRPFSDHWRPSPGPLDTPCHIWRRTTHQTGYGMINVNGKPSLAHRYSWALVNGPIPDGLCVCHKCDVRNCVNPEHLFLGTIADNNRDMFQKGRNGRTGARREKNGNSKLSRAQVAVVQEMLSKSGRSQQAIGRELGVSQQTVSLIALGKHWAVRSANAPK